MDWTLYELQFCKQDQCLSPPLVEGSENTSLMLGLWK